MRRNLSALLVILPLLAVVVACDDDDPTRPTGPPPVSITILTPNNGDTVPAGSLFIQVRIVGVQMDCPPDGTVPNQPGHGHWHVYLDGNYVTASCTDNTTIDLTGQASGKHTLIASLRDNNHDPFTYQIPPSESSEHLEVDHIISINVE